MAQNKVPSLDKSGSALKTETEHTDKLDTKKDLYHYPVQMIKNGGLEPKDTTIKKLNQLMMIKVIRVCLHHKT